MLEDKSHIKWRPQGLCPCQGAWRAGTLSMWGEAGAGLCSRAPRCVLTAGQTTEVESEEERTPHPPGTPRVGGLRRRHRALTPLVLPKERPGLLTKDGVRGEPWDGPTEKTGLISSEGPRVEAQFPIIALPSSYKHGSRSESHPI